MPNASLSQRLDEISNELETLRTQSLSHPDKAAEMLQDGLGQIQVSLKELTALVGEGMTGTERDAFVENKLACEHEKHMASQERTADLQRSNDELKAEIQERKRAGEALRQSEQLYRTLFENTDDAFQIVEPIFENGKVSDFRYIQTNAAFENQSGLKSSEVAGKTVKEVLPNVEPHWLEMYSKVVKEGKPLRDVSYNQDTNRWYDMFYFPYGEGKIGVLFRDITERKQAEEALRESEERFRVAQELSPDGFMILRPVRDENGRVVDFTWAYENAACARMNGTAPDQIVGRRLLETFPGGKGTSFFKAYWHVAETGKAAVVEDSYQGETITSRTWFRAAIVRAGEDVAVLVQDITERKRAEEELDIYRKHLENLVKDRTRELRATNAQLRAEIAERKQAEEALRESELNLAEANHQKEVILESISDCFYALDKNLRFTYVNKAAEEIWGLPRADLIGRKIEDVFIDLIDFSLSKFHQVLEEQTPQYYEVYSKVIQRWGDMNVYPTRDGISVYFHDITDRKLAEEELKKSEEKYRTIVTAANDGFWWIDSSLVIIEASESMAKLLGYSVDELIGRKATDFVDQDCLERALYEWEDRWAGKPARYDSKMKCKDGSSIWVRISGLPITDEHGRFTGNLGAFTDITERKLSEKALRKSKDELELRVQERTAELEEANKALYSSEQRLLLAQKAGGVGVYDWNPGTGEIIYTPELEKIYGMPSPSNPKQRQKAWLNCVHPEDIEHVLGRMQRLLDSTQNELEEEYRIIRPDGQECWIASCSLVIRDFDNRPLRIIGTNIDITERKVIENELRKAKDAAEAAAKAKAAFMANMSHEIRTPMNSVIGFTELILDEPESLSPEQKENLEAVRINGNALLTIINDILDFSKMESDKLVLEDQPFNLRQCVEESLDLVSVRASEKGLNVAYTIDKGVPDTIICDPGRLRQVLGNLLSNAVKFTDEGEVAVSVLVPADGANEVRFAVQDTGIGIPQDGMNQLFQSFNQMEPSTTRLYGGTGLGLAISKKLVDLMGGQIWAESEEGKGSTFHFTIKASSSRYEPEHAAVSPQMIGKCALIIGDNKTNRRLLSKQIYDWGMVPMTASSGQEALRYIQRGDHFDIAILDMDIKDMNSLELEEKIQKYNQALPLILLTSLGKRIPPNHAHLTKPIKQSQLHRVLTEVLPKADILPEKPARSLIMASEVGQTVRSSPLRILLAEDNVSSQKVALQMLKKLGYRADVVANGIEVLQSLERRPYDLVLMDVRMPEMDGLEATRIIRRRWPDNGPKIIAITAYALEGDREKCLEAGMNDYIAKPIQKEDLARALKDIERL